MAMSAGLKRELLDSSLCDVLTKHCLMQKRACGGMKQKLNQAEKKLTDEQL